jgi:hypothetical protein
MAISRNSRFTLLGQGEPERVNARMISADYFKVYEVAPALGEPSQLKTTGRVRS